MKIPENERQVMLTHIRFWLNTRSAGIDKLFEYHQSLGRNERYILFNLWRCALSRLSEKKRAEAWDMLKPYNDEHVFTALKWVKTRLSK